MALPLCLKMVMFVLLIADQAWCEINYFYLFMYLSLRLEKNRRTLFLACINIQGLIDSLRMRILSFVSPSRTLVYHI